MKEWYVILRYLNSIGFIEDIRNEYVVECEYIKWYNKNKSKYMLIVNIWKLYLNVK